MSTRDKVEAMVRGLREGKLLEMFEMHSADDVVLSENGVDTHVGKAAARVVMQDLVDTHEVERATVGNVIVDGDTAAVEWTFTLTPRAGGPTRSRHQCTVQTWRDGKIVRETHYYHDQA
jgi:ketosteroid isomerase-like protein